MEEENKPVRKIKSSGIGHGNIFAQGIPQLRKTPTTDKEPRTQAKAAESHPFALKRVRIKILQLLVLTLKRDCTCSLHIENNTVVRPWSPFSYVN